MLIFLLFELLDYGRKFAFKFWQMNYYVSFLPLSVCFDVYERF